MSTNVDAVLGTISLLSPDEQQELHTKLGAQKLQQVTEAAVKIAAGAAKQPIERRVQKYVQLRDARAANTKAYELVDAQYKATLEAIEASLLATAAETGAEGFKTEFGTVYKDVRMQASIADDLLFFEFVRESGDLDFFERRLKVAHIKEWSEANGGQMPPGLNIFRELTMKVRRK